MLLCDSYKTQILHLPHDLWKAFDLGQVKKIKINNAGKSLFGKAEASNTSLIKRKTIYDRL